MYAFSIAALYIWYINALSISAVYVSALPT